MGNPATSFRMPRKAAGWIPRRAGLLAVVAALVLAGCGGLHPKSSEAPSASRKAHPKTAQPYRPLTGAELVSSLLPPALHDKAGWTEDIVAAFDALQLPATRENVCAVLAEIGQESSFQAEPVVPGLPQIVRRELEARRKHYRIPQWLMERSLAMRSPDGRSYNQRIDALHTENDVNDLYEEMISEIPLGRKFLADYNPVHTGGPMQVNVGFADAYAANRNYPYSRDGSVRDVLFTRKGGLYFGIAYLLDYQADYDSMRYRFADFNAGRYSSRNAAFQRAVSALSGIPLQPDGDLLIYRGDAVQKTASRTMRALLAIAPRLHMDRAAILRDILLEKSAAFGSTRLYARVYALESAMPRASVPAIEVSSIKFSRKLSTVAYANRVDARYRRCLGTARHDPLR